MATQELDLALSPTELLLRCSDQPLPFALDGGGAASWGSGRALLGFGPRATLRVGADGAAVVRTAGGAQRWSGDPFALLDRFRAEWSPAGDREGGGTVAALSYDLRHWVERLAPRRPTDAALPVLHAAAYDWTLSYAYAQRSYQLASRTLTAAELRTVADEIACLAAKPVPAQRPAQVRLPAEPLSNFTRPAYLAAVREALAFIAAGDIYQVNLAQRFRTPPVRPTLDLYAALQRDHAAPFAAYVDVGDGVLVSNSPECFLTWRGDRIATFPIKGTRPRSTDAARDAALAQALRADAKECAEHVMIVDLERNDLGRVCRTGSVQVEAFAAVQSLPTVHHLVSTVAGNVRGGTPLAEILRAMFPGGSITGAPKIRAMEIIDAIEPVGRGFYTGAIGFIGGAGDAVFNLAIRTVVAGASGLTYHAGGGIVADSDPSREYEETLLKARPFFAAVGATAL